MHFGSQTAWACLVGVGFLCATGEWSPVAAQHPPVVRGRVVVEGTGQPVAGARIQVVEGTAEALSDPEGAFLFRGLLPGTVHLRVEALGYLPRTIAVEAENGRVTAVLLGLHPAPLELPGIVAVAGARRPLPPGAVVLGAERIRRSGARDVAELLASVPGVTVVREGGPGAPAGISIRGSSVDEVLVLLDGMPLNSLLTGDADLSALPTRGLERVVVLRGGSSFRYGPRALGGVVLIEGARVRNERLSVQGTAGSFGERVAVLEVAADSRDAVPLAGALSAEWRRTAGDFDYSRPPARGGGTARRANADASRRSLRAGGRWPPAGQDGPVFEARLEVVELARGMPGPVVQPSLTARQEQSRYGFVLSAADRPGDAGRWRVALHLQRQDARFRDPDPPLEPPFDQSTRVDGLALLASAGGDRPGLRWGAGLEARAFGIRSASLSADAADGQRSLGLWTDARFTGEPRTGLRLDGGPGLRVDWSSGLRHPWISPGVGGSLSRGPLTGRFAIRSSFSPPTLADQFFQEGVLVRANPALEPERVWPEIDVGLDATLGAGPVRLDLTAEAFRADVRGMIVWLPDHRFVWSPRNVDVRRRGVELSARAALPRGGVRAEGAVSRTRVDYAGPVLDGQVVYRPEITAHVGLAWSRGGLQAELDGRYTGARRTVPGSALNALEPFWIFDLRLSRGFRPRGLPLEASLRVENLLDARAAMLPDYPRPGRAWTVELRARPFHSNP